MTVRLPSAIAALALASSPAAAQQGPLGIAFAQEAEVGAFWCLDGNAARGIDCARAQCVAEAGGECLPVAWCYPAGWSAQVFVWLPADITYVRTICGAPTRAAAEAAQAALCAGDAEANRCELFRLIDPDGAAIEAYATFAGGRPR